MLAPDATGSINTSAHFIEDNEINAIKKGNAILCVWENLVS